jgi:F0F1-type ATP synthase assembly protein I
MTQDAKKNDAAASETKNALRQAGLALSIPSLLLAGPLVGLFLGRWIGGFFGHSRAGLLMVFRVFEKMSYGIVMKSDRTLAVMDRVTSP